MIGRAKEVVKGVRYLLGAALLRFAVRVIGDDLAAHEAPEEEDDDGAPPYPAVTLNETAQEMRYIRPPSTGPRGPVPPQVLAGSLSDRARRARTGG